MALTDTTSGTFGEGILVRTEIQHQPLLVGDAAVDQLLDAVLGVLAAGVLEAISEYHEDHRFISPEGLAVHMRHCLADGVVERRHGSWNIGITSQGHPGLRRDLVNHY